MWEKISLATLFTKLSQNGGLASEGIKGKKKIKSKPNQGNKNLQKSGHREDGHQNPQI